MMGWRQELKSADEWDVASIRCRKILKFRPGERSRIKRALNKRARKTARLSIANEARY